MQKLWQGLSKIAKKEQEILLYTAEHLCSSFESLKYGLFDNQQAVGTAIRAGFSVLRQLDKGASAIPA